MRVTDSLEQFRNRLTRVKRPLIVAVCGGSGSGKTTLARLIQESLGPNLCAVLSQDSYYIDQSRRFDGDGGSVNFDHPSAIDFALMREHLVSLTHNQAVAVPIYEFATHKRLTETQPFPPRPMILVDGILILHATELAHSFDFAFFISTSESVRFARRLERDVKERGREPEGVRRQFLNQVKPMHDQFVEPSRTRAKRVLSGEAPLAEELKAALQSLDSLA